MDKQRQKLGESLSGMAHEFGDYIRRNRYIILVVGILMCMIHGDRLFSLNHGIDTEKIIFSGKEFYASWLGIGRQGLVFLKWMLGLLDYNPYFAGLLALLFFLLAYVGYTFLFEVICRQQGEKIEKPYWRLLSFFFGMLMIAHPIMTEQLYFTLQGAEVALSFVLSVTSLFLAHTWSQRQRPVWFFLSLGLAVFTFAAYQAMVPLYLFGITAMCCLRAMCGGSEKKVKEEAVYMGHMFTVFLCGFFLNQWITGEFFQTSDYVTKQMQWDILRPLDGVRRIVSHVKDVVWGGGTFYSKVFFFLAFFLALIFFLGFRTKENKGMKIWKTFLLLCLYASPFYLTVVMGERPVVRGQLVLPFTTGFLAYLGGTLLQQDWKNKIFPKPVLKTGIFLCCVCGIWQETAVTSRMYYTDAVRYHADVRLAGNIEQDIAKLTDRCDFDGTVVFIGKRKASVNRVCLTGDVMGQSLFAWDTEVEPVNYWSSSRIIGFMHCMGANYKAPTREQVEEADKVAGNLPCYPAEGSIARYGDMILVKLSETEK